MSPYLEHWLLAKSRELCIVAIRNRLLLSAPDLVALQLRL